MKESKEDSKFTKDIAEAIRQSNETLAQPLQQMSMSMHQIAQGSHNHFSFLQWSTTLASHHVIMLITHLLICQIKLEFMAQYIP